MRRPAFQLLLTALPALGGGWLLLGLAGVGPKALAVQAGAGLMMLALAMLGAGRPGIPASPRAELALQGVALLACAVPLIGAASKPVRWIKIGPMSLYVAAAVVPAALVAFERLTRKRSRAATLSAVLLLALALVIALQPDAAHLLALALGVAGLTASSALSALERIALITALAALTLVAFLQPDPLHPVPHVETVFKLAFQHGWGPGLGVLSSALAFLGLLFLRLRALSPRLGGLACYYLVLFAASVAGLTPAPLIGYGAGPLLGFGLMAAAAERSRPPGPQATPMPSPAILEPEPL